MKYGKKNKDKYIAAREIVDTTTEKYDGRILKKKKNNDTEKRKAQREKKNYYGNVFKNMRG